MPSTRTASRSQSRIASVSTESVKSTRSDVAGPENPRGGRSVGVKESGPRQVLVADADRLTCQALSVGLAGLGLDVRQCTSVREARAQLDDGWPELLVLELRLADGPSLGLLSWVRTACFDVRVVVVTGHSSV